MSIVKYWIPVVLWTVVILAASNETFSSGASKNWMERILGREVPPPVNVTVRKLAHVLEYGILAALVWRADRRAAVVLGYALVVAILDETRQGLTRTRSGSPWDVMLDFCGALIGMLLVRKAIRPNWKTENQR